MKHYTYHRVTRQGKKDGRDWKWKCWPFVKQPKPREPKENQDIQSAFENEILQAMQNDISLEAEKWRQLDKKLKPQYCSALVEVQHAHELYKKESDEASLAQQELETARQKYEELEQPSISKKWKLFWLILIGIVEFPLNSQAFAVMGHSELVTYLFAAGLCVTIPLFAHLWGETLRQRTWRGVELGKLIGIPVAMLLLLAGISMIRGMYFEAEHTLDIIGINFSPTHMTVLFIIINIGLFLAASLISYEACPKDRKYHNTISKRYHLALQRFEKEAAEESRAKGLLARYELQFQQIRQLRQQSHQHFLQNIRTIAENAEWLVQAYRTANMQNRPDIPPVFRSQVAAELPQDLLQLDWDCADPTQISGGKQ